jgi:hypothetical protein
MSLLFLLCLLPAVLHLPACLLHFLLPLGPAHSSAVVWSQLSSEMLVAVATACGPACLLTAAMHLLARLVPLLPAGPAHPGTAHKFTVDWSRLPSELLSAVL